MARYMILWEMDTSRMPEDTKAKKAQWLGFQDIVKKNVKEGVFKEWGQLAGGICGYCIFEGSAVELHTLTEQWIPYVKFKVGELLTIDEINEATKALPE
jgi:hypothetical protein